LQAHKVVHLATPRKSEHTLPRDSGSWTLRSAGGKRPALIIWGTPPSDATLDRLARSGLAVITTSLDAVLDDLIHAVKSSGLGSVALAFADAPPADLPTRLDEQAIPWLRVTGDWDDLPRWCAGRLR
jgi:hypothetical protein